METTIAHFTVKYLQILNEEGVGDKKLMPLLSNAKIKEMYQRMIVTRMFDTKAIKLQRQGRLGTYASVRGQEACQIPSALLMHANDLAFPSFREHGVFLTRGATPEALFQYWSGDERGMHLPQEVNVFPVSIPVGTHLLHAVGAAMAFHYQRKNAVTLAYFSDGATSEGDFHEAMNFAGVFKAPIIFICQNNQWAISTPVKDQTKVETLAQKAIAYGFEGISVDGNDVFAVHKATSNAFQKARTGKGPTFIECLTYRLGDHTSSDDATRYRSSAELQRWEKKDPLIRLEKYLLNKKILSPDSMQKIKTEAEKNIADAVKKFEAMVPAPPEDIFNFVFAQVSPELKKEKDQIHKEVP